MVDDFPGSSITPGRETRSSCAGDDASTVCATCGALDRVGALLVYERAPGMVARCAHCEGVQMRIASDGGRYRLDLRLELRV